MRVVVLTLDVFKGFDEPFQFVVLHRFLRYRNIRLRSCSC